MLLNEAQANFAGLIRTVDDLDLDLNYQDSMFLLVFIRMV